MHISTVPDRIVAHATASPAAPAVAQGGEPLTYAELGARADRLAHHLLAHGVRPGDLVGVCLDRGAPLVVALLGVLRAGCGYLPLDPDYPPDRLRFMLRDSVAATLIGTPADLARVAAPRIRAIDPALATAPPAGTPALPDVSARDLAYVIYTSGSTGTPKGVAVEHGQVARLFDAVQQRIPVSAPDIWSWFHSVAFDFSVWEIWGALTSGGCLVPVSAADARDPAAFLEVLRRSGTTVLSQTPSAFHGLVAALPADGPGWTVRAVILGGEAVSVDALAGILRDPPGRWPALFNLYGITETTVHTTVKELTAGDLRSGARSPIGTPLPDLRLALLDQDLHPVPPGETGELWVGGAGVARGYIGRPELTAQRFVTGLLPEHGTMRWYRSGDLARQLPSGEFEYIGRIDRQVKLRGFRIELGEIEAALTAHPAVTGAAVDLRDQQLGACLAIAGPSTPSREEMREWLVARLPSHMIPSSFTALDALPLTPNGKVDREALRHQAGRPLPRRSAARQPQAGPEARLYSIWSDVLGTSTISRDDSFFAMGGDSMLALRVVAACKKAGISLTVRDLFIHPTLAALARVAAGREARTGSEDQPSAPDGGAGAAPAAPEQMPASQMQRGMLFEAARNPGTSTYHVVSATTVACARDLSEPGVKAALRQLAGANVALRLSFDLLHFRRPMQIVRQQPEIPLTYLDLCAAGPQEQQRRTSEVFEVERNRRFGEHDFPLWRLACVQTSAREATIMLAHHHALLDGWSVARFFDQLTAVLSGEPGQDVPASINAAAVRREDEAIESAADNDFWRGQISRWRPLPVTCRAGSREATGTVCAQFPVDEPLREAIRQTAARWQCAPKHIYLAAHLRAMARFAHWDDYAATGMVVNGRPELPEAPSALGMFLNVVPLVVPGLGPTWADLAQAGMAAETRLQPHRWYPQATMITKLGMRPVTALFNFTDFSSTVMRNFLTGVTEASPNSMPLTVSVVDDGLIVEGASQYFAAVQCAELAGWHEDNLRAAVAGSGQEAGPGPDPARELVQTATPGERS